METTVAKWKPIEHEGKPARLYPDGSVRNERGHWLTAHPAGHTITHEDASKLQAAKVAKKRARVQAGALAYIQRKDPDTWGEATDDDWVEAVAEAQAEQAMRVGDPGMTRAADWLMTHAGMAEPKQAQEAGTETLDALAGVLREIAHFAASVAGTSSMRADAVDAEAVDIATEQGDE